MKIIMKFFNYFYRNLYTYVVFLFFLILLSSPIFAQDSTNVLKSGNFTATITVDDTGGNLSSTNFRGDASLYFLQGTTSPGTHRVCLGLLCIDIAPQPATSVSFLLEVNISGPANDTVIVDNNTIPGLFRAKDITRYFSCIEDASIQNTPVVGIVYAGSNGFRHIKVESGNSFSMKLVQNADGNRFVIPVTQNGCDVVKNRLPLSVPSILTLPFVAFDDVLKAVELAIRYQIDLVGDFERTGSFTLVLEKNQTQIVGEHI